MGRLPLSGDEPALRAGAIILAAGAGLMWEPLAGRPVVAWSVEAFARSPFIAAISLVTPEERMDEARALTAAEGWNKVRFVVTYVSQWRDAIRTGLAALDPALPLVVIHDGARPLVTPELIAAGIAAASGAGVAVAAEPVKETIKRVRDGRIAETVPRERLVRTQTPQVFARHLLPAALAAPEQASPAHGPPDAAPLALIAGLPVVAFPGAPENLRVTTPDNLAVAAVLLGRRTASVDDPSVSPTPR